MDMRERIARAIEPGPWGLLDLGMSLDTYQKGALDMSLHNADAVLDVLREPDERMIRAALIPLYVGKGDGWVEAEAHLRQDWERMIDSARTPRKEAVE